jgi:putative ABC transport system permease protein
MEHKAKSLIIGIIIAIGVMVILVGNSFLDKAKEGVKTGFTSNFTGDAYIYGDNPLPISILLGNITQSNGKTPLLVDYDKINQYLDSRKDVVAHAGQVSGIGMFSTDESGMVGGAILVGVEPESYHKMFNNLVMKEGEYLEPGKEGFILSKDVVDRLNKSLKKPLKVGDEIIVNGMSSTGFNMRRVKITGLFGFKTKSDVNEFMAYTDVNTVRLLSGLTLGGAEQVAISESTKTLLNAESEDDIFGAEESVSSSTVSSVSTVTQSKITETPRVQAVADTGAWQFILVKLKDSDSAQSFISSANLYFAKEGIKAKAGDWMGAASPFAQSIDLVRSVLLIVVIILVIVAIIIIMNTLVVSIIERTGEIGTMRALGAQKSYVWKMFLIETLCITVAFGIVGIALSGATVGIINLIGIKAGNSFLRLLFAGEVLKLGLNWVTMAWSLVLVALVGIVAHIYPVMVALRIEPVVAMQAE